MSRPPARPDSDTRPVIRPNPAAGMLADDLARLDALYLRGTPANTRRAYERDLVYIAAWKEARFGQPLLWPECDSVALGFVLDHAEDLAGSPAESPARLAAETLIAVGLRRSLAAPAPATLDRRIATWQAFHRLRNLDSPFEAPLLRQARAKARRARGHRPARKSARPITLEILEAMLATCEPSHAGLRDRAVLLTGFASGGRRRSELAGLRREDLCLARAATDGLIRLRLGATKTTSEDQTPELVLKGSPARALQDWLDIAGIGEGFVFRAVSRRDRVLARGLSPAGIGLIVKRRLVRAGFAPDFASAHGLRSGFLTEAARAGAPIQAAMRLSLHRSVAQAQRYYDDVEIDENPAADLVDRPRD